MFPSIEPLGDSAALIAWRSLSTEAAWLAVQNAAEHLNRRNMDGIVAIAPAFRSLTVYYNCGILDWNRVLLWISETLLSVDQTVTISQRRLEIPVCYDNEFALDLDTVAATHDLTSDEVIHLHSNATYVVQMIGFSPGFPYLAGLHSQLHTPRRDSPRIQVPAGSVAIGGEQTGIYSCSTPGGWHIVGRTPVRLFDPQRNPPCLLQTGDTIRFVSIDRQQFDSYAERT
jgi:inhibitor of KinA